MASNSERYERLAEIVDAAESDGTSVTDTTTDIFGGALHATIEVKIDEGRVSTPDHSLESRSLKGEEQYSWSIAAGADGLEDIEGELEDVEIDADEIVDELEGDLDGEEVEAGDTFEDVVDDYDLEGKEHNLAGGMIGEGDDSEEPADAAATPETADQEDVGVPTESDVAPADLEDDEDDEDEQGAPNPGGAAGEVLAALREEGESSASTLQTVTGVSSIYKALHQLSDDGLVEKRDDPTDARRTLYSPAEWLVDDEAGPETVLAESGVPDRHSLDAVLDAIAASNTVYDAAQSLDVAPRGLEEFCERLDLKDDENRLLATDVDERVEEIRQEVEA